VGGEGREGSLVTTVTAHDVHAVHPATPPSPWGSLRKPGFIRCVWTIPLLFAFGASVTCLVRWLEGWEPVWLGTVQLTVAMVTVPLGFLAGIGGFDYWLRYAIGSPTQPEDHSGHGAYSWRDYFRVNTDHKVIGIQYIVTTFFFFVIGGLLAMLVRAELAQPGMQYVDTQGFNSLMSVHATLMIFLFIIPVFAGIGNYVIPLMIGAPDMAFPRLNALSYWLLPIAGVMFAASFFSPGGGFASGWTCYAPLCTDQPIGSVFFNMGVQWAGASSIMTALNFLVTIITMRAPGMTFWRMPLLVWANFTTSLLVVLATPFIAGSQFFVMFDRVLHTNFFVADKGGYALGYQHIFWFYSHPAVYIMMLPGFGIVSEVISTFARKPVFGYRLMALSLIAILMLGFSVWAHHMFVAGMAPWLRIPMMVTTLLIAVPTGIKVFSWLATLWEGRLHLKTPMLFALGFLWMFLLGGLSGIYLGSVPVDIHASDTYFVVAHIHYVLFGGSLLTIFAGIYYWFPKMTGRMYNERLGKLHFFLTFIFFNLTFFPMHWLGLQGMPRRVADYSPRFEDLNLFISISSFALGASAIVFLYNMVVSWARGPRAPANPWRANSIEWQVSSPPPVFNFAEVPQVVGGPYEYGVPGARHAVFAENGATKLEEAEAPAEAEVHR
jgi:cytochrome c oxidase subunit 1